MDSSTAAKLATAAIAPKLLNRSALKWIAFGAVAYYGLKYLSKKGMLPDQGEKALGAIDQGIDMAKENFGLKNQFHS